MRIDKCKKSKKIFQHKIYVFCSEIVGYGLQTGLFWPEYQLLARFLKAYL